MTPADLKHGATETQKDGATEIPEDGATETQKDGATEALPTAHSPRPTAPGSQPALNSQLSTINSPDRPLPTAHCPPQPGSPLPAPRSQLRALNSQPSTLNYVLVTPARNEESLIEATIKSVVAQTVLPLKWVIVSDGSTDRTDEIVRSYADKHPWIELLRRPERKDRQFAAKAHAFNAGYELVKGLPYDVIGNLDADITFDPEYFSFLLSKLQLSPRLGVVGTPFVENFDHPEDHSYAHRNANMNHVSGACQMFRRECFAEIGGYIPVKGGAIDWIAVTTARMKGWQTRTFKEKVCFHHRKIGTGTGENEALRTRFHYGQKAYYVGGHPLWEFVRGVGQMRKRPYILAGSAFIAGYIVAAIKRIERPVSKELMAFHRGEQMARLKKVFGGKS